jgi:hypothetical protein
LTERERTLQRLLTTVPGLRELLRSRVDQASRRREQRWRQIENQSGRRVAH